MSEIVNLEPRIVWEQFDAITRVPRPSKKEGKIIEFLVDFARKHNIEYKKDAIGNVVMRKPATPGFENRPTVILQSHMDMVCEKNSDVEFDFDNDPIRTHIDGGWVRAEGTTLGADCGIGMAAEGHLWEPDRCEVNLENADLSASRKENSDKFLPIQFQELQLLQSVKKDFVIF